MDKKPNYEFFQKETDILLNYEKKISCRDTISLPKRDKEIKMHSDKKNNFDKQEKNKNLGKKN